MAEPLRIPWPLWKCHFDMLGGARRMGFVLVIAAMALVAGYLGFHRLMQPTTTAAGVAQIVIGVLAGAQGVLLLLGGVGALHKAHTRDADSKMIESHRLTPMTNTAVVVGYLFGPTQQILALFTLVLVFGSVIAWIARGTIGGWLVGNAVLFAGALSLWSMAIFAGMRLGKPFNVLGPIVGLSVFANAALFMIPGLGVMVSAYSCLLGFAMMAGLGGVQLSAGAVVICPQLVVTAFWLLAAAAKYRRPDLPALNGVRGIVLLILWLAVAFLGILAFEIVAERTTLAPADGIPQDVQWSVSLLVSMLVAIIPINGAAHCRVLQFQGASLRGWTDRVSDLLVALVAALLIILVPLAIATPVWRGILLAKLQQGSPEHLSAASYDLLIWGYTAAACVCAMLTVRAVLVITYARFRSPKFLTGFFLVIAWCLPPVLDLIISEATRASDDPVTLGSIFGCSPVGTILVAWHDLPGKIIPGLIVQAALAIVVSLLAWRLAPGPSKAGP